MEVVKAKAWKEFVAKNVVLPPAYDRVIKESDQPTPFCIGLKQFEGIEVKADGPRPEYQLRVSLFDVAYKQFFGRSWVGPLLSAKVAGNKHKVSLSQNIYFYTCVKDTSILIVFELVAVENHNGRSKRYSKGWGFIRPFASDDVPDVSASREPSAQRLNIYGGSVRGLLLLKEPIDKSENIQLLQGCTLSCNIMTNLSLLRVQHLLPENVIIGSNDIVPGVVDSIHTDSPLKDCFKKPKLLKSLKAFLDNVSVSLYPNIDKFEDELLTLLNEDRLNRDNTVADGSTVAIAERRLLVGVHNGFCYVEKPEVAHLVAQDLSQRRGSFMKKHQRTSSHTSLNSTNLGSTFVLRDRVPVNGMVYDPMFTIVFTLEYMIIEPVVKTSNQLSMNKNQSFPVSVRWTAWSPFTKPPAPGEKTTLSFVGGPNINPDHTFTYKVPKFEMESASAIKEMSGTMTFTFIDIKKGMMQGQETGSASLSVPYPPPVYASDTSAYTESVLQSAGPVIGKPPRSAPTTPSDRSLNRSTTQLGGWSQPRPSLDRGTPNRQSLISHTSPSPERRAVPEPSAASPRPLSAMGGANYISPASPQHSQYVMSSQEQQHQQQFTPYQQPMMMSQQQAQMHQYQGHVMSLPPPPSGYPVGPVGYPMEIRHLSNSLGGGDPSVGANEMDLEELPFTPVHATIMAVPPGSNTGSKLSRAAYARLYAANFPPILDRHKQESEVVNPNDYLNFVMAREESDPLQCNEIILQFLAFSRMSVMRAEGGLEHHSTVFFTFQFYKFPHITTERLLLGEPEQQLTVDKSAQPCILRRLAADGKMKQGPAGYQIKYVVDPTHMKPGEGSLFVRHLSQQTLHVDVWDGDSLLLIGSAAVELKHLCRQGREGVQVTYELDIMASEVSEDRANSFTGDLSRGGSVRPVGVHTSLRGKLHLRLANIGHPVDAKYLPKSRTLPNNLTSSVIKPEKGQMQGSFTGGSLINIQNTSELHRRSAKANHLAHTNTELSSLLHSRHHDSEEEQSVGKRNRKLARMIAVREQMNGNSDVGGDENRAVQSLLSFKNQKAERARDLKIMEAYRTQSKADGIKNMLNQAITTEHVIHPSMGTVDFFEYQLTNPNNTEATISIKVDCDDISVITGAREWRHFKQLYRLDTPIEEGMFNTEVTKRHPEVFLRPKETVYIPMKYVNFDANHTCAAETPGSSNTSAAMRSTNASGLTKVMSTRMHKVHFNCTGDNKLLAILSLRVEPEPHVIDQTFRFHQPEQSFLKKSIRLPPFQNMVGGLVERSGYQQLLVKCSDASVVCESYKRQTGEPQDVFIKAAVGASPQQKKFFVCIYSDPFMSKPDQIWQFYVHALQRVDVSCIEGQTTRISLILRGTQSSRLVKCFTSHANQMQVSPNESFMLAAGAVHELYVGVKPLQSGTKFFYLNVVDIECHQLVRNWLICVNCSAPIISKTFELHLPAGGGKGSNKRISFTNPYSQPKTFVLTNNRNDLLQFKDTRLDMYPKETRVIGLRFMPALNTGSAEILIFINDEDDKNEETFAVKVNYILEEED